MNLWQRFKKLTFWNKIGAVGAICSILAVMWLLFPSPETSVNVAIENVTIKLPPQLERKLAINAVYVNKPQDEKYVTLLRGRLKAPYPVPNLRIEAHGETVEKIEFTGTGIYVISDRGKNEGYVFATWQDAIGNLEFKIVSRKPGKPHVRFVVQE